MSILTRIQHFIGKFKLKTVLTASLLIILICAMSITGILGYLNSQYAVDDLAGQVQNEITERITQHLDTYLSTPYLVNKLCLDSFGLGEVSTHDNEAIKNHFLLLSYRFPSVEAICYGNELEGNYTIISSVGAPGIAEGSERFWGVSNTNTNYSFEEYRIDRDGNIIEKTLSNPHYDPRTRPWYKAACEADHPVWTPIYMWIEGVVSQDVVVPVFSKDKELLGVLDTSLTLTGIGDFLQTLRISDHGQAYIMERSGLLVASSSIKEPYTKVNGTLIRLSALECNNTIIQSTSRYLVDHLQNLTLNASSQQYQLDISGMRQLVQVSSYKDQYGLDWLIVVVIPESDFMGKIAAHNQTTIFLIIGSVIVTIIICIFLARWITRPIVILNNSVKSLAQGDWTSLKELDRSDELGELSNSFKQMADQLRIAFLSLKTSEERYMKLFQSSADAILLFDQYSLVQMNHAGEEMFAASVHQIMGNDVRELFGPIGSGISEMIQSYTTKPDIEYIDNVISRIVDGTEQYMSIRLTQVIVGKQSLNLIHIRDITDQRRAIVVFTEQEALQESYSRITTILHHLPDPTFIIDINGSILFWNQAIEQMTGYNSDDMIGSGDYVYSEAIHGERRPSLIDLALHPEIPPDVWYTHLERLDGVLRASICLEKDKEEKYYSVLAARLLDKNGTIIGAIESIRDITLHKKAEEALRIVNKKLNLLSSITRHDILNKIMITKGHLFLLEEFELAPAQKDSIAAIKRSMDEIEHFISFTKTYQELGLKLPVWQDVGETFAHAIIEIQADDILIQNEISSVSILADPLFEKVCYNLIDNAIRHGEHLTKIRITANETLDGLRISVEDDGGGVPDDNKEIIFERGYGKNTGYGLFLSREILAMSDITITERGMYGKGCRFDIDVMRGRYQWKIVE